MSAEGLAGYEGKGNETDITNLEVPPTFYLYRT